MHVFFYLASLLFGYVFFLYIIIIIILYCPCHVTTRIYVILLLLKGSFQQVNALVCTISLHQWNGKKMKGTNHHIYIQYGTVWLAYIHYVRVQYTHKSMCSVLYIRFATTSTTTTTTSAGYNDHITKIQFYMWTNTITCIYMVYKICARVELRGR